MGKTSIEATLNVTESKTIGAYITSKPRTLNADFVGLPSSGSGGTTNYERLRNKPSIESVELIGNKDFEELGLIPLDADDLLEILT